MEELGQTRFYNIIIYIYRFQTSTLYIVISLIFMRMLCVFMLWMRDFGQFSATYTTGWAWLIHACRRVLVLWEGVSALICIVYTHSNLDELTINDGVSIFEQGTSLGGGSGDWS